MRRLSAHRGFAWWSALVLITILAACDDLPEEDGGFGTDDDADAYPYYLTIGGGLSETLSVLKINDGPTFELFSDVALTGTAINQTTVYDDTLYAVCSLSNSVAVYDRDLNLQREISVGTGVNPMNLALTGDGQAWISGFKTGDVRLVDLRAGVDNNARLLAAVPMPSSDNLPRDDGVEHTWARPNGVVLVQGEVFVALSNLSAEWTPGGPSQLAVIDADAAQLTERLTLQGRDAIGLTFDETRQLLWVASAGDYESGSGFVGNGRLEAIDPGTRQIVAQVTIDGAPFELLIGPDGRGYLTNGLDASLVVVDLDAGEVTRRVDLRRHVGTTDLSFLSALALDPAGHLYATDFNSDYLYVLDTNHDLELIFEIVVNDGPDTLAFL